MKGALQCMAHGWTTKAWDLQFKDEGIGLGFRVKAVFAGLGPSLRLAPNLEPYGLPIGWLSKLRSLFGHPKY